MLQYRARLSRNAAFRASTGKEKSKRQKDSEATLRRVLIMDPTDGRAYVTLGKLLLQQKRIEEARKLYDDGAAATGTIAIQCACHAEGRHAMSYKVVNPVSACIHAWHQLLAFVAPTAKHKPVGSHLA